MSNCKKCGGNFEYDHIRRCKAGCDDEDADPELKRLARIGADYEAGKLSATMFVNLTNLPKRRYTIHIDPYPEQE